MNSIKFTRALQVRWSDLDPNGHMRHSVYYDYGAQARIDILRELGISIEYLSKHGVGPILFREECVFRKEIRSGDDLVIQSKLKALRNEGDRFSILHQIYKDKNILCAEITIDGAWLDTGKRKLTAATEEIKEAFRLWPRTDDFIST